MFKDFVIFVVQMTSEWREIDFADADISLLGVTKITDVRHFLYSSQLVFMPPPPLGVAVGIMFFYVIRPCVRASVRDVSAISSVYIDGFSPNFRR